MAFVVRGFIPDGARSGPKQAGLLRNPSGINPLTTGPDQATLSFRPNTVVQRSERITPPKVSKPPTK